VEEEVDELGDLKVVNRDLWLVFGGDDQTLLFGFLAEPNAPRRYTVDATVGESCVY
jgi:hypothetical protein